MAMSKIELASPRWLRHLVGRCSRHAILILFSMLALLPIYFMLVNAFKTKREYVGNRLGPPLHPVLTSVSDAMAGGDLYVWLLNSFLVTVTSIGLSTAFAALAA